MMRFLNILFLVAIAIAVPLTLAQNNAQDPPGTIDGAKTPDLIPDSTAWEVFL